MSAIFGVDVSRNSLDIFDVQGSRSLKISNEYQKILDFLGTVPADSVVFYENTGIYSSKLGKACNNARTTHYQVNAGIMHKLYRGLSDRNKNDKLDASKIAQIGKMLLDMYTSKLSKLKLTLPNSNDLAHITKYVSLIDSLRNQMSRFKQMIERLTQDVYVVQDEILFYKEQIKVFKVQQDHYYQKLEDALIGLGYGETIDRMSTIPTVSTKLSVELTAFFVSLVDKGITKDEISKVKAFAGIDPTEQKSGTSLSKVHISKRGRKGFRCLLFMTGMKRYQLVHYEKYANTDLGKFFQRMYDKFTVSGSKHGKRVIIAMAKKILLVARGIFWNGMEYDWRR